MFDKAEQRASELETNLSLLEVWKNRGDELLYSMIPKPVAEKLRSGNSPLSTCQVRFKRINQKKVSFIRWRKNWILEQSPLFQILSLVF